MKENAIKAAVSAATAAVVSYFGALVIPLAVLFAAMVTDYLSGMAKAWVTRTLSSRVGIVGIIKKVCYLLVVAVGMGADWAINTAMTRFGVTTTMTCYVGLVVIVWLVINEAVSILENLADVGVPIPSFLGKIFNRLKNETEKKGDEQ